MRKPIFKEALAYLTESGEHCSNGPINGIIIEFIEKLYSLGALKIEVALYEHYNSALDEDEFMFESEIYLHLPDLIHTDVIVAVAEMHPDEIGYEENGSIRLWWD